MVRLPQISRGGKLWVMCDMCISSPVLSQVCTSFALSSAFTTTESRPSCEPQSVYFKGLCHINFTSVSGFPCKLLNLLELMYRKKGFNTDIISRALGAIGSRFSFREFPLAFRFLLHRRTRKVARCLPRRKLCRPQWGSCSSHLLQKATLIPPPPFPDQL